MCVSFVWVGRPKITCSPGHPPYRPHADAAHAPSQSHRTRQSHPRDEMDTKDLAAAGSPSDLGTKEEMPSPLTSSASALQEVSKTFATLHGQKLNGALVGETFSVRFDVCGSADSFIALSTDGTTLNVKRVGNAEPSAAVGVDIHVRFKTAQLAQMYLQNEITDTQWMRLLSRGSVRMSATRENALAIVRSLDLIFTYVGATRPDSSDAGPVRDVGAADEADAAVAAAQIADDDVYAAEATTPRGGGDGTAPLNYPFLRRHLASDMLSGAWLLLAGCVVYLALPVAELVRNPARPYRWCELTAALYFVAGAACLVHGTYPHRLLSLMGGLASSHWPRAGDHGAPPLLPEVSLAGRLVYSNWLLLSARLFSVGMLAFAAEGLLIVAAPDPGVATAAHGWALVTASLTLASILSLVAASISDEGLRESQGKGSSYAFDHVVAPLLSVFGNLLRHPQRYAYWKGHLGTDTLFVMWLLSGLTTLATAYAAWALLLEPYSGVRWLALVIVAPVAVGCGLMTRGAYPQYFNASLLWQDELAPEAASGEKPPAAFWPEDQPPAILERMVGSLFQPMMRNAMSRRSSLMTSPEEDESAAGAALEEGRALGENYTPSNLPSRSPSVWLFNQCGYSLMACLLSPSLSCGGAFERCGELIAWASDLAARNEPVMRSLKSATALFFAFVVFASVLHNLTAWTSG